VGVPTPANREDFLDIPPGRNFVTPTGVETPGYRQASFRHAAIGTNVGGA